MSDLIASNEFGDWLLGEMAEALQRCSATDAVHGRAARLRLDQLEATRRTLEEYLLLQQAMIEGASRLRQQSGFKMSHVQDLLDRC